MNIAYLHRTKGRGVEGVHINEIIRQFKYMGHCVDVISPVNESQSINAQNPAMGVGKGKSIVDYFPEFLFECLELSYNFAGLRNIARLFKNKKINLIYERYAIFNIFGVFFAKNKSINLVLEVNYTSLMPLVRKRNYFLKPFARLFDAYIFRNSTRLIAVSSYLKEHLISEFKIPAHKITVLPNAADPDKFKYIEYDLSSSDRVIGFVGGFYPWHGVDMLVDSFRNTVMEFPQARLVLVGDGPERN
ncbi:MAG: glycosyltransferase family 4 protein, partial [Gammaproteobacteria bacterium]|nr:glycosyltransferase family 4 protein [Gammaproteobacteria bacterium]